MSKFSNMRNRIIPENILQGKRILGIKPRNFFEGIAFALGAIFLIRQIPFVEKVSWIVTICVGLAIFLFNSLGIKGQSITQVVFHFFQYRKFIKTYSYRRLSNERKETQPVIVNGKVHIKSESKTRKNLKKLFKENLG